MKKILALVMILGVMLAAVNAASAAGRDASITISGYELGKSVRSLDAEVIDNENYVVWSTKLQGGVEWEVAISTECPDVENGTVSGILTDGTFQANTQYYAWIFLTNSYGTVGDLLRATYLINGEEPLGKYVKPTDSVYLYYELPMLTPAPATGDAANIVLWSVLMAAGFAGMVMVLRRRRA